MTEAVSTMDDDAKFEELVHRLSRQSVDKHFDAYEDVDWDAPEMAVDPTDARWELPLNDTLATTAWYRAQPPETRARIGLFRVASAMKVGLAFESVLKRGLFEFAARLPNASPEFRYVYHEAAEETQHALMFQEFVNRSGFDIRGIPIREQFGGRLVAQLGWAFPELFFVFVLGGEDPIDFVQRRMLRGENELHPLLERIVGIHVTEEARHLSFARHWLKLRVPRLDPVRHNTLSIAAPVVLGGMARLMLTVSPQLVGEFDVPADVVKESRNHPSAHRTRTDALAKVRRLIGELGLLTPAAVTLWRTFGIWDAEGAQT